MNSELVSTGFRHSNIYKLHLTILQILLILVKPTIILKDEAEADAIAAME